MDPKATILGVSAFASVKGEEMMEAGAKEVISKPVRMPDLLSKVRSYIMVENYGPDSRI